MPFAVVNHSRIDDADEAAASARDVVLPRLRQMAGFQQATFLTDPAGASGFSVMVFETRDQAEALAARLGSGDTPPPGGITFVRQEVYEVVAGT